MTQKFYSKLEKLLKKDKRFIDQEGDLLKSNVVDATYKADKKLIEALLSQKEFKSKFFSKIKDALVFNINDFVAYIQDKNFLADSYTKYRNKIGLNIDDKFLNERKEVTLVWPFKDCVLEGGQSKEDSKSKEILFNEILAQDEIDKLLAPKVLTNWKKYTQKGEEKVKKLKRDKDGTIRENLIVKGNNLLALHSLKEQFQGKVKLIYIDPPYNTGNDSFGYNDNFNHSTWLTFMKNRLEVARELLREDGSIWMNIDDTEAHYLKVLCDDIFGRENFVANVVWQKKYTTANDATGIPASHDHILVFQKTELFKRNLLPRGDKQNKLYKNKDKKGLWRSDNLLVKTFSPEYVFPIMNPYTKKEYLPREGSCWRANKKTIAKWLREGRIYFGKDSKGAPQLKRYLNEVQQGVVPGTWWKFEEVGHNDESKKELQRLDLSRCEFTTPKPERLIQRILGIGSNEGDLALDFFAGSATTGAVAMKMKRQFILTEQMDYVEKVTVGRLRKVIGKNKKKSGEMFAGLEYDQGGISEEVNWKGGGEFIYCELMKYNEQFVDKIRQAKSTKELLKIWEEMKAKSFLNYNVDISKFDKTISDFKKLPLAKQKHTLFGLLNKNQLYVNLSEIKDGEFKIKEEDKKVNKEFYGTE